MGFVTDHKRDSSTDPIPGITPHALSAALAVLGAHGPVPAAAQLDAAAREHGYSDLSARLSNALYGVALAQVMNAESDASLPGLDTTHRDEARRAIDASGGDAAFMLQYTAKRLADELHAIRERLPSHNGVVSAASTAALAVALLLEVTTIEDAADPRGGAAFAHLQLAGELLTEAGGQITSLCATIGELTTLLNGPSTGSTPSS